MRPPGSDLLIDPHRIVFRPNGLGGRVCNFSFPFRSLFKSPRGPVHAPSISGPDVLAHLHSAVECVGLHPGLGWRFDLIRIDGQGRLMGSVVFLRLDMPNPLKPW